MGIDAIDWCRKMEDLGAGELLPTSMDRDGTNIGYDIPLTKAICYAVSIPVIASGGTYPGGFFGRQGLGGSGGRACSTEASIRVLPGAIWSSVPMMTSFFLRYNSPPQRHKDMI